MGMITSPINRTLAYWDDRQQRRIIGQEDIAAIVEPVVILGDPGTGKSVLAQTPGQWHRKVWNAASDQLDACYAREWHAQGRGVYIVLWFGDVPEKQLHRHPDRLERPQTPQALLQMLVDCLPEARRSQIDVFVVDVTRPAEAA